MQFELQNSPRRAFAFDGKVHTTIYQTCTTKIFDIYRIIKLKQQKFSQSDPILSANFQKICSPIQSWSVLTSAPYYRNLKWTFENLLPCYCNAVFLKLFYSIAPFTLSTRRFRPPSLMSQHNIVN